MSEYIGEIPVRVRTEAEIKAYVDGYNACYKQFCECLKVRPLWKAVEKMGLFVTAVNGCFEDEPQTDYICDKCAKECKGDNRNLHVTECSEYEPKEEQTDPKTNAKRCPHCGTGIIIEGHDTCPWCGKPIEQTDCPWR